ncbi:hypothetical protein RDI58_014947 [Solanum bulbocastanum]|uniref:Uncharacterized protein n=1 Tax=Solanum bulbocastanum TaxID=147425 RepID=A0AAN8TJK5_SOLBU
MISYIVTLMLNILHIHAYSILVMIILDRLVYMLLCDFLRVFGFDCLPS